MFCPQCRVEYRPGFTRCSDCDVDLVYELPPARTGPLASNQVGFEGDNDEDPFCSFWQGDDARLHTELCAVLDEASIAHKTIRRQDHLFNLNNYPAFQIGVPFSLFEKAEAAVKDAYEMDSSGPDALESLNPPALIPARSRGMRELPGALTPAEVEDIPGPPEAGAGDDVRWEREGDAVEVWSGGDRSLGDMLVASLRENKIPARRQNSHGKQSLFVSPQEEARAREIVKEIVEGVPPE